MKNVILFLFIAIAATTISCDKIKLSEEQKKQLVERIVKETERTPLTQEQMIYAGKWICEDGTYFQIYKDGNSDLKTAKKSVEGGNTIFTDKTIEIEIFGIGKKYKIDKPPYKENGETKMKLDGVVYTKRYYNSTI